MPKSEFKNPIDKDKITENPSTLPYAHTVGGAVIKPTKQGVIRSKALAAMEQQTDMQLEQIKKQIDLLAEQAKALDERRRISEIIYSAKMSFKPEISHLYHLYFNKKDEYVLSLVAPNEWGLSIPFKSFVASVRLLADHTWEILKSEEY
jgi:hypothetical protein